MTGPRQDRLYELLPALYRRLDDRHGEPLRALMAVLESEFRQLEGDVAAMYDDWFIETCSLWVVPYIADLLGIRDLKDRKHLVPTQRRRVANTIGYRRRKGTAAVLEHVVRDVTGWHARCIEFARQVARTQHMARTQPDRGRSVDVRQQHGLAEGDRPFDSLAHTASVDNSEQGKFSLDRIGLFLYRLRSYPIQRSSACAVDEGSGHFTFDPLGRDIPLFNQPEPVTRITHPAQPYNLPLRLSRGDLAADLHAFRSRYGEVGTGWPPANSRLYGPDRGLYVEGYGPLQIASADLSGWPNLADLPDRTEVAIDVELGRLAFKDRKGPGRVRVNYNYGFSSEVGGGPYGRQFWLDEPAPETHHIYVAKGSEVETLHDAFREWKKYCQSAKDGKKPIGRITVLDSGLYGGQNLVIDLPRGAQLTIAAGDGVRPIIGPDARLRLTTGGPRLGAQRGREEEPVETVIDRLLHLNGLIIDGRMQIGAPGGCLEGKLDVEIQHCTLMPDGVEVQFKAAHPSKLRVDVQCSIVGPMRLPAEAAALTVQDSIIGSGGYAIAAPGADGQPDLPPEQLPGPPATLERTTIFGKVSVRELLSASEVIFTEPVFVEERERGSVSFSYVPAGSGTPPREFCQPRCNAAAGEMRPRFTSVRFGDPAYAQLSQDCPSELRRGGRDGTEMGVFCHLHGPQRETNLGHILEEYLPSGMSAAVSYVT